jgi:hypothetical protein
MSKVIQVRGVSDQVKAERRESSARIAGCALIVLAASAVVELLGNAHWPILSDAIWSRAATSSLFRICLKWKQRALFETWLAAGVSTRIAAMNSSFGS